MSQFFLYRKAFLQNIGPKLRERRLKLGMSLEELGRLCSISPTFIERIEKCRSKTHPSLNTILQLCRGLNCQINIELADREADKNIFPSNPKGLENT